MKLLVIMISIAALTGCETSTEPGRYKNGQISLSAYLKTMNTISVAYAGKTEHHYEVKQGSLDSGHSSNIWSLRRYLFMNNEPSYKLTWEGDEFSTRTCFELYDIENRSGIESGCEQSSLIRAEIDNDSKSIRNLLAMYRRSFGMNDPMNFESVEAILQASSMELDSLYDDSVRFTVKTDPSAIQLSYRSEEHAYGTFSKKVELVSQEVSKGQPRMTITFSR